MVGYNTGDCTSTLLTGSTLNVFLPKTHLSLICFSPVNKVMTGMNLDNAVLYCLTAQTEACGRTF